MANLSNINNVLRVSSSGVGINKNNTGPSELDIESAGADMIDMTRTNLKTYRLAISGASDFSIFDVVANEDRLTIDSSGDVGIGGVPSEKLTIDGTTSGAYVRISNVASGDISSGYTIYNGSNLDFNVYTNPTFGNTTLLSREALAIRAGGAQRMYIRADGGVAIGGGNTGYSSQILSVKSDTADNVFYGESSDANCFASFRDSNSTANIEFGAIGNSHVFRKDTSIKMVIDGDGDVGIGITSPGYKLSVANASTRIISATYIDGANGIMSHAGAPNYGLESFQVRGDFISFWTDYDASHYQGTEKMRIDSSGKVGVANTNPSAFNSLGATAQIVIGDADAVSNLTMYSSASGYGSVAFADSNSSSSSSQYSGLIQYYHVANSMTFYTSAAPRMTILSSGNVGIGTTSPQNDKLHVETDTSTVYDGNSNQTGGLFVNNIYHEALNTFSQIRLGVSGASGASNVRLVGIEPSQAASDFAIVLRDGSVWGEKLRIKGATGYVGIGTPNPSKKLSVNGGIVAGNNNTDAGASQIYGDIRRPQATNFSKRNYILTAGAGDALYSIARQWHDTANWGSGNINVIMWGIYYGRSNFSKADFSCRYGYSGNVADVEVNFNPGGLGTPSWTAATQVSGNVYYRDLQILIPAYTQISFEIISPGLQQTYNLSNTSNNTVYLYPH